MKQDIAEKVRNIVTDSLYRSEEVPDGIPRADAVIVDGLVGKMGFHPQRLESHRAEVEAILREMSPDFFADHGGGATFLNLCMDKNGDQWGEHRNCNDLVVLAIGLRLAKYCLPREMWPALPGGMPYIVFNLPMEPVESVVAQ